MIGKYTMIFDGNFFLHKTFFVGMKMKRKGSLNFVDDVEGDRNILLWKLAKDFAAEIKRFSNLTNRIVYCIDSNSWRKDFYETDPVYKGTREKDESVNWKEVYAVHDEFIKQIESIGVITSRVYDCEADDLIFGWSSYLNQKGDNAIILSGDGDMTQLVNKDRSTDAVTLFYNKFSKNLYSFVGFKKWLMDSSVNQGVIDIFNQPIDMHFNVKEELGKVLKSQKLTPIEISPAEFMFNKILVGDSGDNVSPVYVRIKETKAGPRTYRVTDKMANEILKQFKENRAFVNQGHLWDDEYITEICEILKSVVKITDKSTEELMEKWKRNRNMMYLHIDAIPKNVSEKMFEDIESNFVSDSVLRNITLLEDEKEILKGSYYQEDLVDINKGSGFGFIKKQKNDIDKPIITKGPTEGGFDSSMWDNILS